MSTQPQFLNSFNKRLSIAALIFIASIIIVLLALSPLPVLNRSSQKHAESAVDVSSGFLTDGTRYAALAKAFTAQEAASVWLGQVASSARYTGQAELWLASVIQRGRIADSIRYTALADAFNQQEIANPLRMHKAEADRYTAQAATYSVPVHYNLSASLLRGRLANAARYSAIANFYTTQAAADSERNRAAETARYDATAAYYHGLE